MIIFALILNKLIQYKGSEESFSLTAGQYTVHCYGAQGGGSYKGGKAEGTGGYGAHVYGTMKIYGTGTLFYANVGGEGKSGPKEKNEGGFNGGGTSGKDTGNDLLVGKNDGSGGGGGSTDLRIYNNEIGSRIIVAAGGSGAVYGFHGCDGGDENGRWMTFGHKYDISKDTTQDKGNALLYGGNGGDHKSVPGSGGGGGYWGGVGRGGSPKGSEQNAAGDSGSSYVAGFRNCAGHEKMNFTDGGMIVGESTNTGNGHIEIFFDYVCSENCYDCKKDQTCDRCAEGFYLYLNKCYTECPRGSVAINGAFQCETCHENCDSCSVSKDHCDSCKIGFYFYNNKCIESCPIGTTSLNGICELCMSPCTTCIDSPSTCLSCEEGFFLYNGKCYKDCSELNDDENDRFFGKDNEKSACRICEKKNCVSCAYDYSKCERCSDSYHLNEITNECIPNPTQSPVATPIETPVATPIETPVATPIATPVETPIATPIETPISTPVASPIETPISTPVATPIATPIETPIATPVASPIATPIETPIATPIETPVATPIATPVETPIATPIETPISTPVASPIATPIETPIATPIATPIETPIATPVASPIATPIETPVATPIATPIETPISTPVASPIATPIETPIATPIETPVASPIATPIETPIATPIETPVATPIETPIATPVATPIETPIATPVATPIETPVATPVATPIATPIETPIATPIETPIATPVQTPVSTPAAQTSLPSEEPDRIIVYKQNCTTDGRYEKIVNYTHKVLVEIKVSNFSQINDQRKGGAIHIINSGLECDRVKFNECKSYEGSGGAIHVSNTFDFDNSIHLDQLNFNNCEAQYGGAVYIYSSSPKNKVTITHCTFVGNIAKAAENENQMFGGSAIFLTSLNGVLKFNRFSHNTGPGGSIKLFNSLKETKTLSNDHKSLLISECSFEAHKNSNCELFYVPGEIGCFYELSNCEFKGELNKCSHYIDGKRTENNQQKLMVKNCRFQYDAKKSLNLDPNNNFMHIDLKNQMFEYNSVKSKKKSSNTIITIIGVPVVALVIVTLFVAFTIQKTKPNVLNENLISDEVYDLF